MTDEHVLPYCSNKNGKVNKAQTINISNRNIIIHLGTGYFTYEE